MQSSQFSFKDVSRAIRWLVVGLAIFPLSCSLGLIGSFYVTNELTASLRNSQLSPIFANVLEDMTMVLVSVVISGPISAFLGNLLFESELAAHRRRWYRMVVLGTLVGYLVMVGLVEIRTRLSLAPAPVDFIVPTITFVGGGIAGLFQWLVLRRVVRGAWIWIPIVAVSWTIVSLIFLSLMSFAAKFAPLD